MGNGRKVKFWRDNWCIGEALCNSFPSLYVLANSKDAWVAEIWDFYNEVGGWNPCFVRPFNDWEVDLVGCFI